MRILIVNYEYPPVGGGAGVAAQAIGKELIKLGHEIIVLTGKFGDLPSSYEKDDVIIHRVPSFRRAIDRSGVFEMASFLGAVLMFAPAIIRKHRVEAAIIFFSFPCGPIGLLAKWRCDVPYVVSLRGGDVPGAEPSLNFLHRVLSPVRRAGLKSSTAVIANSEGLRTMAEASDPFPVRVIPNGVDTEFFSPAQRVPLRKEKLLRILFVGRFQEQKNLSFLVQQLAQLSANTFELHLVGDGPQRKQLERLSVQLGINAAVTWHGWLARASLPAVYQSVDCLVNPSLYEGTADDVLV